MTRFTAYVCTPWLLRGNFHILLKVICIYYISVPNIKFMCTEQTA